MNNLIITSSDLNTDFAEPRVGHPHLASALGLPRQQEMQRLIERNRAEFERYGEVCVTAAQTSAKGGRPGKILWLNEGQCILAAVRSDAPLAAEVRHQVITVFMAYRRGSVQVKAHERRTSTPVDQAVRLRTNIDRLEQAVSSLTMPHSKALATVGEMLRMFEADEAEHAKLRSVRIAAIRDLIADETTQRQATIDGVYRSKKERYSEVIPAMIAQGKSPSEIARRTGASPKTVYRYRALA